MLIQSLQSVRLQRKQPKRGKIAREKRQDQAEKRRRKGLRCIKRTQELTCPSKQPPAFVAGDSHCWHFATPREKKNQREREIFFFVPKSQEREATDEAERRAEPNNRADYLLTMTRLGVLRVVVLLLLLLARMMPLSRMVLLRRMVLLYVMLL